MKLFLLIAFVVILGLIFFKTKDLQTPEDSKSEQKQSVASTRSSGDQTLSTRKLGQAEKREAVKKEQQLLQGFFISARRNYEVLIRALDLSEVEKRYFEELLARRMYARFENIPHEIDREIEIFLNHPEDFQTFLRYEEQYDAHQALRTFQIITQLSPERHQQLVDSVENDPIETVEEKARELLSLAEFKNFRSFYLKPALEKD